MSNATQAIAGNPIRPEHERRDDQRPPFVAIALALSLTTVLFVGDLAFDAYKTLVVGVDIRTDPSPVAVTVGPVTMAVPRNMIRASPLPRGSVSQLDLQLHWPTMEGFTELRAETFTTNDNRSPIIYASLRPSVGALSPQERERLIYSRLLDGAGMPGPSGLTATPFGAGHGYDGEILYTSGADDTPFVARCATEASGVPPTCIVEFRTADGIDVLYRFRRHLLSRWRAIDKAMRATVISFMQERN
jgi:hypothetical protein